MADKTLEDKAVEILDASQHAIGAFGDKLADLAKQYGPDVAEAALQMARVDAMSHLVTLLVLAVVLAIALKYAVLPTWKWARTYKDSGNYSDGFEYVPAVLLWMAWSGCAAAVVIGLSNLWLWFGIFEPKLWLAKRILGL